MSDFHQNGVVTVLHGLGRPNLEQLEAELQRYATTNRIALVLPSLYSELQRPALKKIVETLTEARYVAFRSDSGMKAILTTLPISKVLPV